MHDNKKTFSNRFSLYTPQSPNTLDWAVETNHSRGLYWKKFATPLLCSELKKIYTLKYIIMKKYIRIVISSIIISVIAVFVIDYFSHLLFSNPMETIAYFLAKMAMYFIFSIIFLSSTNLSRKESIKVIVGGVIVASIWGSYYNILPEIFDYYPSGISLRGLTFLGMWLWGTGIAFGIIHTIAFVGGYYANKVIMKIPK